MRLIACSLAPLLLLAALPACDDGSAPPHSTDTQPSDTHSDVLTGQPETTGGNGVQTRPDAVKTTSLADRQRTVVDATDGQVWTHLSLDSGLVTTPTAAPWALAFQRYLIKLGPGVQALAVDGVAFADLTTAPATGYRDDTTDPAAGFVFDAWYDYDISIHALAPKANRVYVVLVTAEKAYKIQLRDYYDDAGSPGVVTFDWAPIAPPASDASEQR